MEKLVFGVDESTPQFLIEQFEKLEFKVSSKSLPPDNATGNLAWGNGQLGWQDPEFKKPLVFDLSQLPLVPKGLKSEPFARAIGLNNKQCDIWDATCGTGKDSLLMMAYGHRVKSFERNPWVFLLLQDALYRAENPFELFFGSCLDYKDKLDAPDLIYYDPMFPDKKKKALPRKEMQIFKKLGLRDQDEEEFIMAAKKIIKNRLVIKRPVKADVFLNSCTASFPGKSARYDMYMV
ncbi:MAG: class I SAM-dependent methyltransferase [Halobacteriovoraceae bacterium]|nr:class I SAM-dependent methyltransferase [Halobacteriovoraceae bacterium]